MKVHWINIRHETSVATLLDEDFSNIWQMFNPSRLVVEHWPIEFGHSRQKFMFTYKWRWATSNFFRDRSRKIPRKTLLGNGLVGALKKIGINTNQHKKKSGAVSINWGHELRSWGHETTPGLRCTHVLEIWCIRTSRSARSGVNLGSFWPSPLVGYIAMISLPWPGILGSWFPMTKSGVFLRLFRRLYVYPRAIHQSG